MVTTNVERDHIHLHIQGMDNIFRQFCKIITGLWFILLEYQLLDYIHDI